MQIAQVTRKPIEDARIMQSVLLWKTLGEERTVQDRIRGKKLLKLGIECASIELAQSHVYLDEARSRRYGS